MSLWVHLWIQFLIVVERRKREDEGCSLSDGVRSRCSYDHRCVANSLRILRCLTLDHDHLQYCRNEVTTSSTVISLEPLPIGLRSFSDTRLALRFFFTFERRAGTKIVGGSCVVFLERPDLGRHLRRRTRPTTRENPAWLTQAPLDRLEVRSTPAQSGGRMARSDASKNAPNSIASVTIAPLERLRKTTRRDLWADDRVHANGSAGPDSSLACARNCPRGGVSWMQYEAAVRNNTTGRNGRKP